MVKIRYVERKKESDEKSDPEARVSTTMSQHHREIKTESVFSRTVDI